MNWTDIAVLIIIVVFTIIGLKNGFLYSVFRLLSYILSVIFAIKFYPVLSSMLQKTVIFTNIKTAVVEGIIKQQSENVSEIGTTKSIVDGLKLPSFLKASILENVTKKDIFGVQKILDAVGSEIAMLVINILSVILIYVIIRFALIFARIFIKAIARLPVFKQLDKTGGLILGAIEGIFIVYILCALLILFSAFPKFSSTIESIEGSQIASHFYQNNFIVSWMSPEEDPNY
ncbi:MAG: CvpA family protein [Ruminiclostridium sp.]